MLPEENEPLEGTTTLDIPAPEAANDNTDDDAPRGGETPAQTEERRFTRKERKDQRFNENRRIAADAEKRLAQYDEERAQQRREMAELKGKLSAYEQRMQMDAQRAQRQDPAGDKIQEAHKRAYEKLKHAASVGDPAKSEAAMQEYHEAMTEASGLAAERRMQAQIEQFRQSMPNPQTQGIATTLASEFDWLPTNVAARQLADGYVAMLVNNKGRQPGLATYREACAMAARDFGLGGAVERPSEARRAAFSGVSGRTSGEGEPTKLTIPQSDMGPIKKMAVARYPELEPDAAMGKWLKVHGSKLK